MNLRFWIATAALGVIHACGAHAGQLGSDSDLTADNAASQPLMVASTTDPKAKTPATEWLFQAALGADYLQSLQIHQHPNLVETNGLLGGHPNEAQITSYFLACGVLHWLITRELVREHVPSAIVQSWEAGTSALEMAYVAGNAKLGIHFYVP